MTAAPAPSDSGDLYLQYGCGFSAPEGWLNFDASPQLRLERLPLVGRLLRRGKGFPAAVRHGDVRRGLPVEAGSCRGVYASHVLEHLAREDFDRALAETFRILAPGGVFRLVVPDLETYARRYVARLDAGEADANDRFMDESYLGARSRAAGLVGGLREAIGNSRHLWMWDEAGLAAVLDAAGFTAIRRATFGDADDPMFARVEEENRFQDACAMEARKPGPAEAPSVAKE